MPVRKEETHAEVENLTSLFGSTVSYRIPQFQRSYSWNKDGQWEPLWDDVRQVSESIVASGDAGEAPRHFMGAIVLQHQRIGPGQVNNWIVVDGQQRLTTLQLLIRATQDSFLAMGEAERATRMNELTLNDERFRGGDEQYDVKIRQSDLNDQASFQESIRDSRVTGRPLRPIDEASDYFKARVTEWLSAVGPEERLKRANALEKTLRECLKIASIRLDKGEKPHFIFGVLNARAEPLKESDHVKNTVMYKADVIDDREKARTLWGMFESNWWRENTKERLDRIHLDRFLNYWTVMRTLDDVPSNRVSRVFSRHVDKVGFSIEEIANDLQKAGIIYQQMENRSQPGIETFLNRLNDMDVGVVMPLLLWLFANDVPDDQRQVSVRALESYLVRRMLCGLGVQGHNRLFLELLKKLDEGGVDRAGGIVVVFLKGQTVENREWPDDGKLYHKLTQNPLPGNHKTQNRRHRMVLEAIERHLETSRTVGVQLDGTLTVEHIIPDKWEDHWPLPDDVPDKEEGKRVRDNAVGKIGNLTLLTRAANSSASNKPWSEKKKELAVCQLLINRDLMQSAPDVWDEDAVDERSGRLCEYIREIWPYADEL